MSWRAESSQLIAGRWVAGDRGLGVRGFEIPSTGDDGASFLYNDLELPGDSLKEIRGHILTVPSGGTFAAEENGAFSLIGAPVGAYSFTYRLYLDGADLGTATAWIYVGTTAEFTATLAITDDGDSFSGSAAAEGAVPTPAAEMAIADDGDAFSGSASVEISAGATPTRRELIIRQVVAALSATSGIDGRIYRARQDALAREESPALVVLPEGEGPTEDIVGKTEKILRVIVAIYQRGSTPDSLADSIAKEVHVRIMQDPTLGGLAIDTAEDGTSWDFAEADETACWLDMRFRVWYRHDRADLTS